MSKEIVLTLYLLWGGQVESLEAVEALTEAGIEVEEHWIEAGTFVAAYHQQMITELPCLREGLRGPLHEGLEAILEYIEEAQCK